jgi:hypothetical protein
MRRAILLPAVLLGAAYVGYPYLTLYWIDRALITDDEAALTRLVDFPRVRTGLKADLKLQVLGKAHAEAEKRPILGALGAALAGLLAPTVVDNAVDGMVTPRAILDSDLVVEHQRKDESFAPFVTYAFFSAPTRFRFDLKDPNRPDSLRIAAKMDLVGPRWRVVAIELPPVESWFVKRPE